MIIEEEIKRFTDNAEYERTNGNLQGCLEFKQLADWLKELKQLREQEPCEDAVSRQQAISTIRNLYPGRPFVKLNLKKWQEKNKKYFECENIIKALPSVTPTRKKGKWIAEYDKSDGHFRTYHCSNCENLQGYTSNFCEECGSENREVEE